MSKGVGFDDGVLLSVIVGWEGAGAEHNDVPRLDRMPSRFPPQRFYRCSH
jgi:hypothetical protein